MYWILYYRVAKTGSRSFIRILKILGKERGFLVDIPRFKNEDLTPRINAINKEIKQILICHEESKIRARHFSFIDFKKHDIDWSPQWFSIVRHPITRVFKIILVFSIWILLWTIKDWNFYLVPIHQYIIDEWRRDHQWILQPKGENLQTEAEGRGL